MKSGIYKIEHASGRVYIGSSINVNHRILVHKHNLRSGHHSNMALQNAWNKYGEIEFSFQKIFSCDNKFLIFYEQAIIDEYKASVKLHGYNLRVVAQNNMGMRKESKIYKIGAKFGRLTLIGRANNNLKYLFLCDCGKQHIALANNVRKGNTKSCGCLHNELNSERYTKVKIGDKYNKFTLVRIHEKRPGKHNFWVCKCDCGIEKIVNVNSVVRGGTKSCGCIQKETATRLRGVLVMVNGEKVSCAEAERRIGMHKGGIHAYSKRHAISHQQATDHFAKKKIVT